MIVFSEIQRCQLPHSTQFFQKRLELAVMAGGHSADDEVTEIHGDADIDPPKKAVLEVSSGEEDVEEVKLVPRVARKRPRPRETIEVVDDSDDGDCLEVKDTNE